MFEFVGRFGLRSAVTVHQTAEEVTWPGGVLWDLGVLLSHVLVAISGGGRGSTTVTTTCQATGKKKSTTLSIELPPRVCDAVRKKTIGLTDASLVLELGSGVGLTGLVAAVSLHAKLTVLTDLKVVVDHVTRSNVEKNSVTSLTTDGPFRILRTGGRGKIASIPLCWGSEKDEESVRNVILQIVCRPSSPKGHRKNTFSERRPKVEAHAHDSQRSKRYEIPDVILIGDVAYQHKPGAPSHFEALLSTLLTFADSKTLVVFGTRIRMPASVDLLNLLLEHFEEQIQPPLSGEEIDPRLTNVKHNMSIHFLRRKGRTVTTCPNDR